MSTAPHSRLAAVFFNAVYRLALKDNSQQSQISTSITKRGHGSIENVGHHAHTSATLALRPDARWPKGRTGYDQPQALVPRYMDLSPTPPVASSTLSYQASSSVRTLQEASRTAFLSSQLHHIQSESSFIGGQPLSSSLPWCGSQ